MNTNEKKKKKKKQLVKINNPDKVLFVGEALVGNDGVDQLVKFNRSLREFADTSNPRQIDGIVLTKFDTIDDKVTRKEEKEKEKIMGLTFFSFFSFFSFLFSFLFFSQVGAALSMTYTTGQPIVFVGTGQTYTDLKRLNVKSVVEALMS